jgi:hypothetical protein
MEIKKILGKRRRGALLVAMVFIFCQLLAGVSFASPEAQIDGKLTVKAAPSITNIVVKSVDAQATTNGAVVIDANSTTAAAATVQLNGTNIPLAGGYASVTLAAVVMQAALTAAGNATVTVTSVDNGITGYIVLTGAPNQDIVINELAGSIAEYGLIGATTTAVAGEVTRMDPGSEYNVEVDVTDSDGIGTASGGLDQIELKLWYQANGYNSTTPDSFDLQTVPASTTYANIVWDRGTNTSTLSAGAGTHWSIDNATSGYPTAVDLANTSYITTTFSFKITVSEIATYSTPSAAVWNIGAEVIDTDAEEFYFQKVSAMDMNWYGEVSLPALTEANWGRISPGLEFFDADSAVTVAGMTMLSNGPKYHKIKGSPLWTAGAASVTRSAAGLSAAALTINQFAIKADIAAAYNNATADDIPTDGVTTIAVDTVLPANTNYTPTARNNYLFIQLSPTFPAGVEYTGTITYVVSNLP